MFGRREPAELILDRIFLSLPATPTPAVDTGPLAAHLTNGVRSAIDPIDGFEIKEGVADSVVEALDSPLAVQDIQRGHHYWAGSIGRCPFLEPRPGFSDGGQLEVGWETLSTVHRYLSLLQDQLLEGFWY